MRWRALLEMENFSQTRRIEADIYNHLAWSARLVDKNTHRERESQVEVPNVEILYTSSFFSFEKFEKSHKQINKKFRTKLLLRLWSSDG